jgi:hypothetical protein
VVVNYSDSDEEVRIIPKKQDSQSDATVTLGSPVKSVLNFC